MRVAMDHFVYRGVPAELYAEEVPVARIAAEVGTPAYVYSRGKREQEIRQALRAGGIMVVNMSW